MYLLIGCLLRCTCYQEEDQEKLKKHHLKNVLSIESVETNIKYMKLKALGHHHSEGTSTIEPSDNQRK